MKLKGEKDFKAEELYNLLSNEITMTFAEYIGIIKGSSLEDMNNMDNLVSLIEEEQPVQYNVFIGLLNADFDINTIKVLIDIERKHGNLIKVISNKLNTLKDTINIFNENEVQSFIINSVYLLVAYYELKGGADDNESTITM